MIGLEDTFDDHLENLMDVFSQVRRVLRSDGTLWMNYGDAHAGSWGSQSHKERGYRMSDRLLKGMPQRSGTGSLDRLPEGLKPKDLMMLPFRVALAFQLDGWWVRSILPWCKRNPRVESVKDRPHAGIEYVFMMTKSEQCFYDPYGARVKSSENTHPRRKDGRMSMTKGNDPNDRRVGYPPRNRGETPRHAKYTSGNATLDDYPRGERNFRNTDLFYQTIGSPHGLITDEFGEPLAIDLSIRGFNGNHFATFPPQFPEIFIRLGTSEKGCCSECGAPWVREIKSSYRKHRPSAGNDPRAAGADKFTKGNMSGHGGWQGNNLLKDVETTGWSPTCECDAEIVPCVVLDPFGGAGTTGLAADRLQRDAILIEINDEYVAMTKDRIHGDAPLFAEVT